MKSVDRETIRRAIEEQLAATGLEIEQYQEWVKPVAPDRAIGRLTRLEAISAQKMHQASLRAATKKQRELQQALDRMAQDPEYGHCAKCDAVIPLKRLILLPNSSHCVRCLNR